MGISIELKAATQFLPISFEVQVATLNDVPATRDIPSASILHLTFDRNFDCPSARFGRNGGNTFKGYVGVAMIHILDIDPRIARHCLRAGRLHSGV
jgi:hypothetical protein